MEISGLQSCQVAALTGSESVRVFPNPVSDQTIHLYLDETDTHSYTVRLFNQTGQLVYSSPITQGRGTNWF